MDPGTILVTGGAGYIGSHVVLQLRSRGERVVVLDNLSLGFRQAVLDCPLVVGNVGDRAQVLAVLREHGVDTVMHFAANTIVPESVADPLKYYANNTCGTQNLLKCCTEVGVKQFVFSSTAAVYGIPKEPYAEETTATAPINPYGTSKLMSEWMLRDLSVKQYVFSSTAAVYGIPKEPYAEETTATAPINPYGTSKLMSEWMLRDLS